MAQSKYGDIINLRMFYHMPPAVSVHVQRQTRDGFREDADAGVDRRHLHGGAFGHYFAGGRAAQVESVSAAGCSVLRLVSRFEQTAENTHIAHRPLQK